MAGFMSPGPAGLRRGFGWSLAQSKRDEFKGARSAWFTLPIATPRRARLSTYRKTTVKNPGRIASPGIIESICIYYRPILVT